jgi:hypothetical protein
MVDEQHADRTAAFAAAAADLRASLIQTAQHTTQVMDEIATARENAAANYRHMARDGGPDSARYLQQAEQLDDSAARARRFAEEELGQIASWQQPDGEQDTAS